MSIPKFATVTWSAMGWQKRAAVTVVDLPTYNLVSIIYINIYVYITLNSYDLL